VTFADIGDIVEAIWLTCSQGLISYLALLSFDFERT